MTTASEELVKQLRAVRCIRAVRCNCVLPHYKCLKCKSVEAITRLVAERDEARADVTTIWAAIEEREPILTAQIARGDVAHKRLAIWVEQANEWKGRAEAAEAQVAVLREALIAHNEVLRSAAAIANRNGRETNWNAFQKVAATVLERYHAFCNEARKALENPDE